MTLTLLAAYAFAGLHEEVARLGEPQPEMVLACTSGKVAREVFGNFAELINKAGTDELRSFDTLTHVAEDRPLGMAIWEGGGAARLVVGDAGVETVVARFSIHVPGATPEQVEAGLWALGGLQLRQRGAGVEIDSGVLPQPTGVSLAPDLLAQMPENDGCLFWMHKDHPKAGPVSMVIHVGRDPGQGIHFAIRSAKLAELNLRGLPNAVALPLTSVAAPDMVVVAGMSASTVLEQLVVSDVANTDAGKVVRRFLEQFPLGPGLTLALFDAGVEPRMVVVVPMEEKLRAGALSRRTRKVLKQFEVGFIRESRLRLRIAVKSELLDVAFLPSTVVMATDAALLDEIVHTQGSLWFSPEAAAVVSAWPLVFMMSQLPGEPPRRLNDPIQMGLSLVGSDLSGQLVPPRTPEERAELMRWMKEVGEKGEDGGE